MSDTPETNGTLGDQTDIPSMVTSPKKPDAESYAERQELESKATALGISFRNNIGDETLKERIKEAEANGKTLVSDSVISPNAPKVVIADERYRTPLQLINKRVKDAQKLQRVLITCMNPNKGAWQGEIFTVANDSLNIKRMVPFGTETHVEVALLEMIKERKYRVQNKSKKGKGSNKVSRTLVPEFAIKYLDSMSAADIKDLAAQQLAAAGN